MAHFFAPPGQTAGYLVDNKLAPGSVSRLTILSNQRRQIGLWGGCDLWVRSRSSNIVPNDGFEESSTRSDGLRFLGLLGKLTGRDGPRSRPGGRRLDHSRRPSRRCRPDAWWRSTGCAQLRLALHRGAGRHLSPIRQRAGGARCPFRGADSGARFP